jgi:methylmalonyl-CoA mutase N-terminal domain/subunit
MDEALSLPTEKAVRIALRTQQIIAYESGTADSVDPLSGSYLVEQLTDEIERGVLAYIKKVDEMGGALEAIELGYIQNEIQDAAYRYQKSIEKNEEIIVGVNAYQSDEPVELETLKVDPAIEAARRKELAELRAGRNEQRINELREQLDITARGQSNLLPLFIECVQNDMTLGEICNTLRAVWGEYQPPVWG